MKAANGPVGDFRWGFIIGAATGVPIGLISGAIVEAAREDKVYNFDTPNISARQKRLLYMLEKEKKKWFVSLVQLLELSPTTM